MLSRVTDAISRLV